LGIILYLVAGAVFLGWFKVAVRGRVPPDEEVLVVLFWWLVAIYVFLCWVASCTEQEIKKGEVGKKCSSS
jgi:hypothetical protein